MPWKAYPMFRLTIPLVAGIFLSDTLFHGALLWVYLGVATGVGLLGMGVAMIRQQYSARWLFGSMAFLFLFSLGALLVQHKRENVAYHWPLERTIYKGVVEELPQVKSKTYLCKLNVEERLCVDSTDTALLPAKAIPVNRTVMVYIAQDSLSEKLQCGDQLYFYARIAQPQFLDIPGEFDYATYLFRQQVSGTAVVFSGYWQPTGVREPLNLMQKASLWREKILQCYRDWGFIGDEFAVLSALTVGYREELSDELQKTYQMAGVSHILALSGMHVAILWGLLSGVMRPLDRRQPLRWIKCIFLILTLGGFAFLVGLSASVVRAVLMCMLMTVAQAAQRRAFSFNTLAISAFFMLLYNPFYLFNVSFQLSFLAVISILTVYPVVFRIWRPHQFVLRYIWGVIAVSLAAQVGTSPLVIYYFAHFPVYFLLANLIVAPLAFLIIYGAAVIFIISSFSVVHAWMVEVLHHLLWLLNYSMQWVEHLPWSQSGNLHFSAAQVCLLYLLFLLMLGWRLRHSPKWVIAILLVGNLFAGFRLYHVHLSKTIPQLVLARSQLMSYPLVPVWQRDSIYHYKGITVCMLADDRWRNKQGDRLLDIDYMYLCRGYRGGIAPLQKIFRIQKIVLDTSLGSYKLSLLREECQRLGLDYIDMSQKGSFRILL